MHQRNGAEGDIFLFDATVRAGSFAEAARRLNVTPSAVSRRISAIEERLGVKLFVRTTRSQSLTEAGMRYAEFCARICQEIAEAEDIIGQDAANPSGLVRVGASYALSESFVIPAVLPVLRANPGLRLRIVPGGRNLSIINDNLDMTIVGGAPAESGLMGWPLFESPWVTCAAPNYVQQAGTPRTPAELAEYDLLAPANLAGEEIVRWGYRIDGEATVIRVRPRVTALSLHLRDMAIAGLGIAHLPHHLIKSDLDAERLVSLLNEFPDAEGRTIYLQAPRIAHRPRRAVILIQALLEAAGVAAEDFL